MVSSYSSTATTYSESDFSWAFKATPIAVSKSLVFRCGKFVLQHKQRTYHKSHLTCTKQSPVEYQLDLQLEIWTISWSWCHFVDRISRYTALGFWNGMLALWFYDAGTTFYLFFNTTKMLPLNTFPHIESLPSLSSRPWHSHGRKYLYASDLVMYCELLSST